MKRGIHVGIYRLVSPSGKVYIGQSHNITDRKSRYRKLQCPNQIKVFASLSKYGFEAHTFEVLTEFDKGVEQEVLDHKEKEWMAIHRAYGCELMNIREGGSYGLHPLESRIKNSNAHKGGVPWNKGKRGAQVAWNKGLYIPRKTYRFVKDGETLVINDLKSYCAANGLCYSSMTRVSTGTYHKGRPYRGYKRIA